MFKSIRPFEWQIAIIVVIYDLAMLTLAEVIRINLPAGIFLTFALLGSGILITLLGIGAIVTRNGADSQPSGDPS